ncbi:MAG TPA: GGDEF domain-containing protein, partial [Acidobacteriota bacterium]
MPSIIIPTYLAQAAASILLAVIFRRFFRLYHRTYLQHWSWSWWAQSVYLVGASAALLLPPQGTGYFSWRLVASALSLMAAYPQVAWLLFGTYELTTGRRVGRRLAQILPLGLGIFGLGSALVFALTPEALQTRLFLRVGLRSLVAGLAFVGAGYAVWRFQARLALMGQRLVGGAFFFYGLELVQISGVYVYQTITGSSVPYLRYLGLVDFLAQFVIGLGMLSWFFEEERRRATRASEQIQHLAYHDALTGLPNRRLLLDRLTQAIAQALRDQEKIAVLFMDLDRFKVINDSLGHSSGDDLLRAVATRLQNTMRKGDTVARLGGDEFTLVFPGLKRTADALVIAENLLETLRQPFIIFNRELYTTTSIGISIFPDDGPDAETLLKNADLAMYRA